MLMRLAAAVLAVLVVAVPLRAQLPDAKQVAQDPLFLVLFSKP